MQSKFEVVFGEMNKDAEKWASSFQNSVGGSRVQIKGMLADTQDMLTGFGATTQEAFSFSTRIQELGTDLASFQNLQGGTAEGVERLRKGLLGETENLKAMGIVINETNMKQKAMEMGYGDNLKALTEMEKMEIRYAIALEQSKNAVGDATRTSEGFANMMRNLQGRIGDAVTELGVKLLPAATKFVAWAIEKIPVVQSFMEKLFDAIGKGATWIADNVLPSLTVAFNILSAGISWITENVIPPLLQAFDWIARNFDIIGPALVAMILTVIVPAFVAWATAAAATAAANIAAAAATIAALLPILAPIAAIGLAVAGLALIWKKWGSDIKGFVKNAVDTITTYFNTFKSNVVGIFDTIKSKVSSVWNGIYSGIKGTINKIISAMNGMISGLNKLKFSIPSWVPIIGGKSWGFNIGKIPALAEGGIIQRAGSVLVGEEGPELLNLPSGASVTPLDKASEVNLNINLSGVPAGMDEEQLVNNLVKAMRNPRVMNEIDYINDRNTNIKYRGRGLVTV